MKGPISLCLINHCRSNSLVSVLWIFVLFNIMARKCWSLLLLSKLLHPIWIVDRVVGSALLWACSSWCRYLLCFLRFVLGELVSQQRVSSRRCSRPGELTTSSGLRSGGGCMTTQARQLQPWLQVGGRCCWRYLIWIARRRSCCTAAWKWLSTCARVSLYCFPIFLQIVHRLTDSILYQHCVWASPLMQP